MLSEFPFATPEDIVAEFRPGAGTKSKSSLSTLRRREALSAGVSQAVTGPSGRKLGRVQLYSTLNRDAARFSRLGLDDVAKRFARAADQIERLPAMMDIAAVVAASRPPAERAGWSVASSVIAAMRSDRDFRESLRVIARSTAASRRATTPANSPVDWSLFGRVSDIGPEIAELVVEGQASTMALSTEHLRDLGLLYVGATTRLRWERVGRHSMLSLAPALDLAEADSGTADDGPYPYSQPMSRRDDRIELFATLATSPPTGPRPRPISIAE